MLANGMTPRDWGDVIMLAGTVIFVLFVFCLELPGDAD